MPADDDDDSDGEQTSEVSLVEVDKKPSSETIGPSTYLIKPALKDRFKESVVKNIIHTVMGEQLTGKTYTAEDAKQWSTDMCNTIRDRLKELKLNRYKFIVQITLGEQKGAGVKSGARCLWDSECDSYTSDYFINDSLFCLCVVFAVYFY